MTLTPDGRFLAVISEDDNTIVLFRRTSSGDGLEFVQRLVDSPAFRGLEQPNSLAIMTGTTALGRQTWQFLTSTAGDAQSQNPGGLATFTVDMQGQPATALPGATDGIPLNLTPGTTESTIRFDRFAGGVGDVDVSLDITHNTGASDLSVFLISPSGAEVELFSGLGGGATRTLFSDTTLDDQATGSITKAASPFTGRFRPTGDLSQFHGENPNGTWRLRMIDHSSGTASTGTLNDWSLNLTSDVSATDVPATVPAGYNFAESIIDFAGPPSPIEVVSVAITVRGLTPGFDGNGTSSLTLTSPAGSFIFLAPLPSPAIDADFVRVTFDDIAVQGPPGLDGTYTGLIQPESLLAQLRGESVNGRWTLGVRSGQDEAVIIESWSLNLRFVDSDSYFVRHLNMDHVTVTSGSSLDGSGSADRVNIISPTANIFDVNTLGGQDTVTVSSLGDTALSVNLGNDDDTYNLLLASGSPLQVSAGSGNDAINAYNIGIGITRLDGGNGDDTYRVDLDRIADSADVVVNGTINELYDFRQGD